MSGIKTTYVSIEEDKLRNLRKLAEQASSLQVSNRILEELHDKKSRELADMNGSIANINRRLAEQKAAASKEAQELRTQIQQTVRESNERIQEASRKNEARIREMQQNFTQELSSAISANNQKIEEAMKRNTEILESEIRELETHVNTRLDAEESNKAALLDGAREYWGSAQILLDEIQAEFRVEILCPGRMQSVRKTLESANGEIEDAEKNPENSATARREARSAFEAALQLREDVVKAEQEWQRKYEAARQVLIAAEAQMETSRELRFPEEPDALVEVDFWTTGDLSAIQSRLDALRGQMDDPKELAVSDVESIKSAALQATREIADAVQYAVEAFSVSQDMCEIAQDIADQLSEMGLDIIAHSYQGEDCRSAHRLHLKNRVTGFEIVITQTPEVREDGRITNKLESDILNFGSLNQDDGNKIAGEILSSLSGLGLGLAQEEVHTAPGFEHSVSDRIEVADIQQWKKERSPEIARQRRTARAAI